VREKVYFYFAAVAVIFSFIMTVRYSGERERNLDSADGGGSLLLIGLLAGAFFIWCMWVFFRKPKEWPSITEELEKAEYNFQQYYKLEKEGRFEDLRDCLRRNDQMVKDNPRLKNQIILMTTSNYEKMKKANQLEG